MNMKNNKKKSPMMKIVSAAAMLAVSASMLGTSTYAWFTMNRTVTVNNMAVKAKAEGGLLISEVAEKSGVWDDEANTTTEVNGTLAELYPTSTVNGTAWWHATSKTANDAAANGASAASDNKSDGYTELSSLSATTLQSASSGANGLKEVYGQNGANYYVKYTYYLKTSTEGTTTLDNAAGAQNVMISEVSVSGNSVSANLDKSLRIGVEIGGKFYKFAPISGATSSYYVGTSRTAASAIDSSASATTAMTEVTSLDSLPGVNGSGTPVYIYMWYEGEDDACKSANITGTLDTLTTTVKFTLGTLDAVGTDHGVATS